MSIQITYFVHGATLDNENNLASGWSDIELSELGISQVKRFKELVADQIFDVVFCSDLKRAIHTAEMTFGGKFKIIPDKRLREINYGDLNGKPNNFKNQMTDFVEKSFPNGESYLDVQNRIADFLNFLKINYNHKSVAIVAHQAPQLALEVLVNKKTWPQAIKDDWRNANAWQPGWEYFI